MINNKFDLFDDSDYDDTGFFDDANLIVPKKSKKNGRKERKSRWG